MVNLLHRYIKDLEKGMSVAAVLCTHTPGGSVLSQHFLWKVPDDFCVEAALSENQRVIDKVKQDFQVYHTRAMRKEFVNTYGRFTNSTKPVVLRSIYKELTGMQVDLILRTKLLSTNGSRKPYHLKMLIL